MRIISKNKIQYDRTNKSINCRTVLKTSNLYFPPFRIECSFKCHFTLLFHLRMVPLSSSRNPRQRKRETDRKRGKKLGKSATVTSTAVKRFDGAQFLRLPSRNFNLNVLPSFLTYSFWEYCHKLNNISRFVVEMLKREIVEFPKSQND